MSSIPYLMTWQPVPCCGRISHRNWHIHNMKES